MFVRSLKTYSLIASLACGVAGISSVALAAGTWKPTIGHKYSTTASIKVTGMKGTVKISGNGVNRQDSLPAIFEVPDQNAFITVVVTALDGAVWSEKVEVKAHQETAIELSYSPDAAPSASGSAAPSARKRIGHVRNLTGKCWKDGRNIPVRAEFLAAADGTKLSEVTVSGAQSNDIDVPQGEYDVRVFYTNPENGKSVFAETIRYKIEKDGWMLQFGCSARGEKPGQR